MADVRANVNVRTQTNNRANLATSGGQSFEIEPQRIRQDQSWEVPSEAYGAGYETGYAQQPETSYWGETSEPFVMQEAEPVIQAQSQQGESAAMPREDARVDAVSRERPADIAARMSGMPRQQSGQAPAAQQGQAPEPAMHRPAAFGNADAMSVYNGLSPEEVEDSLVNELMGEDSPMEPWASARAASRGPMTPSVPSELAMQSVRQSRQAGGRKALANIESSAFGSNPESEMSQDVGLNAVGRPESILNRPFGYDSTDRSSRASQARLGRPGRLKDAVKKRAANAFRNRGVGHRIYGKANGLRSLDFREVGVGVDEIVAVKEQSVELLDRLLRLENGDSCATWTTDELVRFINGHMVYVATFKPPNNQGQDMQRRRLKVLVEQRRGIYLHPWMAAMYTADFDGDDMEVSLDPTVSNLMRDPMDYMVGIDGKTSLNMDFIPVSTLADGYMEGKTKADYVREVMLAKYTSRDLFRAYDYLDQLVDAVVSLSESVLDEDHEDAVSKAYNEVFYQARRVADRVGDDFGWSRSRRNDLMAGLCKAIDDGMRDIRFQNVLSTIDADTSGTFAILDQMPERRTYSDSGVKRILEDMVDGRAPSNFQELKVALSGYLGNVDKKNAPFRFSADVGKVMKMDSRFQVGDYFMFDGESDEDMRSLFETTMKFAGSYKMAREVKRKGRSEYYLQMMRESVINEVGFPSDAKYKGSYSAFLDAFVTSYNKHASRINEALLVYDTTMRIKESDSSRIKGIDVTTVKDRNGKFVRNAGGRKVLTATLADAADAFRTVYGTYSVSKMFGSLRKYQRLDADPNWIGSANATSILERGKKKEVERLHVIEREAEFSGNSFWITGKYFSWTISKFTHENSLIQQKSVSNMTGNTIHQLAKDVEAGFKSDVEVQYFMLMALADKRTSTASDFNHKTYGNMGTSEKRASHSKDENTLVRYQSDLLNEILKLDKQNSRDQMLWVDDAVQALAMSDPEMFTYFGMDSTAGFLNSKWGRKMLENANDMEVLGGIRLSMVFEYRMSRIMRLADEFKTVDAADDAQYQRVWNDLQFAKSELSDSSEVWRGIIREMEAEATPGMESVFHKLTNKSKPMLRSVDGRRRYEWDVTYDASSFWAKPGDHKSLRDVIEDVSLDRETKFNVIADVVRYWTQDGYLKSFEVGFQMEVGSNSAYTLGLSSTKGALSTFNDFEDAYDRWSKRSRTALVEDVQAAADSHRKHAGRLQAALRRLDSAPWEQIIVDDGLYADAIMAVKDKVYAQTEKASQHPWTNALYHALSSLYNGGFMNDITRTDDRLLGIMSSRSVSEREIIHLLADPTAELWVYNEYGEQCVLTQQLLIESALGRDLTLGVTESDIWDYLIAEPRVASMLRQCQACVGGSKGDGYVGARLSLNETIENLSSGSSSVIGHVRYLMRDHPIYAGILSLALKSPTIEEKGPDGKVVERRIGSVTRNEVRRAQQLDAWLLARMYQGASGNKSSEEAAKDILDELGITEESLMAALRSDYDKFLDSLSIEASESGESDEDAKMTYVQALEAMTKYMDEIRREVPLGHDIKLPSRPDLVGVDVVSAASFWDTIQELSGAKTNVSTGVEGAETYNFAMWASYIATNDEFANLAAVYDDVDASWVGAWTNVIGDDGRPMTIQMGENGTNIDDILSAAGGTDEVVVKVPEGYIVRDRSTDSSGKPVPSLFSYMVSKRSNGAETFNLKAKKAGIDGKDSITKMRGKQRVDQSTGMTANYFDTLYRLNKVMEEANLAGSDGLMAARLDLAKMMLDENADLGYEDLTLSNYMSIATLMLRIGDDGQLVLRSLEMLFSAVKYRLGYKVDDMSDADVRAAINTIVNDMSASGVGIAQMSSADATNEVRPRGKAGSSRGDRPATFERNYDLMKEILRNADIEYDNIPPSVANEMHDWYMKHKDVREMMMAADLCRSEYNIVGCVGFKKVNAPIRWAPGPSNTIVIGPGNDVTSQDVETITDYAYSLGMTVLVSSEHMDKIPSQYRVDAVPVGCGALLPMFDIRLNGSEATPDNGGRFAIAQVPYDRYVVSVEDSLNEFGLGDAQVQALKSLTDRIKVKHTGSVRLTAESLFPNVYNNRTFRDSYKSVSFPSEEEIRQLIVDGVHCTIDYGVTEGSRDFDQRKHDVDKAIERFTDGYSRANSSGMIMSDLGPGDIVGWAQLEITPRDDIDSHQYVLAPIIPFQLYGVTKNIPERFSVGSEDGGSFSVEQLSLDGDDNTFVIDWYNTSSLVGGFVKYFDSSGGANKGMMTFSGEALTKERRLLDGTDIDAYIAKESTDSRKIGTDRRIKTMISLMTKARMNGYNFAKVNGSFPMNQDIRERLLKERVPRSEWATLLKDARTTPFQFLDGDETMNAFLTHECLKILEDGGNPSDYLANELMVGDDPDETWNTHVMWEFEAMFEQSVAYENGLLAFLHSMDPNFCPSSTKDFGKDYEFILYDDGSGSENMGFDTGVLQMKVPHMIGGKLVYIPDNVYIGLSFFGEDYSGFSRPNVNGASNFMDGMNTAGYYNIELPKDAARHRTTWATADIGRLRRSGNSMSLPDEAEISDDDEEEVLDG